MIFISLSPEETKSIGRTLGQSAAAGEIYCLTGCLGAGKTVFAKGFAEGLGVTEPVTSPTFMIINEYMGRLPFYHFDIYRLNDASETEEIGFTEYLFGDGVSLVEWADRFIGLLPESCTWVRINTDPSDENKRIIEVCRACIGA